MTHYVVIQTIPQDAEALAAYREGALAAVQKHGGDRFAGGPGTQTLEDTGAGTTEVIIASFPSAEAAQTWMDDPALAELHALRRKGAKTTIVLLPPI